MKKKLDPKTQHRREVIEKRKAKEALQRQTETEQPTSDPSPTDPPPPKPKPKAPPGDFPLPKGFVMPSPPEPTKEAEPIEEPPPPLEPKEKSTLDSFKDYSSQLDENQRQQYKIIATMLAIAVAIGLIFTFARFLLIKDTTVTTVVYVDINPSVAIELNKNNKIIQVSPKNAQGSTILSTGNFIDKSLEEGLEILMGLFNLYGYLQDSSTILITVEDSNQSRGEELSVASKETLDEILLTLNPYTTTVGLWADPNYDFLSSAEDLEVSYGKRVLMEELSKQDYFYQLENLLPFSYGELSQLYAISQTEFPIGLSSAMELGKQAVLLTDFDPFSVSITTNLLAEVPVYEVFFQTQSQDFLVKVNGFTGKIEDIVQKTTQNAIFSTGLTQTEGKNSALNFAQKLEIEVDNIIVQQDWSKGRLQYIVSFQEQEHQYTITVLGSSGEILDHSTAAVDPNAVTDLGQNTIQDIAFADAGVNRGDLTSSTFRRNLVDGVLVYEMEFWLKNREYIYQITGSGTILQSNSIDYGEPEEEPPEIIVTETSAKNTALEHVGANFSQVNGLTVGLNTDGNFVVEFSLDNTPYEYQISILTGDILSYEKKEVSAEATSPNADIGGEQAKIIALAQENLKEVMIQTIELSFQGEGETKEYTVSFNFNGFAYRYVIAGNSGEVLQKEKELIQSTLPEPDPEPEPPLSEDNILDSFDDFNDLFNSFDESFTNFNS